MSSPYKTASVYTLGCKVNFTETSTIARKLQEEGLSLVSINEFADIYIINTNQISIPRTMNLADTIRKDLGISVYIDSLRRSIKSQMRHANKMNAKFCIIFDTEELKNDKVIIKNMKESNQEIIALSEILSYFESE